MLVVRTSRERRVLLLCLRLCWELQAAKRLTGAILVHLRARQATASDLAARAPVFRFATVADLALYLVEDPATCDCDTSVVSHFL